MLERPARSSLFPYTTLFRSTPGPVGVAGIFGADLGMMILSGLIFSVPIIFFVVLYAKWLGKNKIYQLPEEEGDGFFRPRSEEHTSELQSRGHLVCRLLLEKKKKRKK